MGEIAGKVLAILAVIALGLLVFVNANQGIDKKTDAVVIDFNEPTITTYQGN